MTSRSSQLSAPAALVRRHDPDRFRFALFAPARHREAVFTLYAFNHEVAKTRESVSETMIGAIRLQWWRDSIEGIYVGTPRQHEVIEPLAACIAAYGLPRAPFDGLINARERDLEDRPMEDLAETEAYLRATTSPLVALLAGILAPVEPRELNALADIAVGHALVGKLRAAAFDESVRRPFLPRAVLEEHGGESRNFAELKADEGARKAMKALSERAETLIEQGLSQTGKRPHLAPLLLPASQARARTRLLAKLDYDPFRPEFADQNPLDIWRFWLARLIRRY
ncbi:phytoene/squalene synthase family protein [Nisaea nitritireducens]|uniref:phytoene/squalene synthase family protein n=1 Tax=Nisaea nitritireducens TaxID=568392 RepID=UPI001865FA4D|nr:squalene/phytoene synthase family protein [Nisaea nitritireducens]